MNLEPIACLNGEWMPLSEAKVPVTDRGFLFGDGVYEVYRLYGGRLWLEKSHTDRLRRSLRELEIHNVDLDQVSDQIKETVSRSGIVEGTVYIQITRGAAPRRHRFPESDTPPTKLIIVSPYDDEVTANRRQTGVPLITQPDIRWGRCDIKSVNLLGNVLACEYAHRSGCLEAVLIDRDGFVTEATHSSLLWIRDGILAGSPEGSEILPGTSRGVVVALAEQLKITFREERIQLNTLLGADEVLLTGTTLEIMPVIRIEDRVIGDGSPGPITLRLQGGFGEAVRQFRDGAANPFEALTVTA